MEGNSSCVRFAMRGEDGNSASDCQRGGLPYQSTLSNSRRPHDARDAPVAGHRLVEDPDEGIELPGPPDEGRFGTQQFVVVEAEQSLGTQRFARALDV